MLVYCDINMSDKDISGLSKVYKKYKKHGKFVSEIFYNGYTVFEAPSGILFVQNNALFFTKKTFGISIFHSCFLIKVELDHRNKIKYVSGTVLQLKKKEIKIFNPELPAEGWTVNNRFFPQTKI